MRFGRRKVEPVAPVAPASLHELWLRDGIATAVYKGAMRERVPDILPHAFDGSGSRGPTRCVVCDQPENHELHVVCRNCGRPL